MESELVDFKIEEGRRDRNGQLVSIGAEHEPAAVQLAKEAACLANTTKGGCLVVGIEDSAGGSAALIGAKSDSDWLRRRIYALTQPPLTVDVEEVSEGGVRLLLINVSDALAETYSGGKLRTRVNTDCVELTGDRAREFMEARRGYDWSAEPSGMHLSDATAGAIDSAAGYYARKHGSGILGARDLASRLGILVDDAADPELSRAGALLLCPYETGRIQLDLIVTVAEGTASRKRLSRPAPVLLGYDEIMTMLLDEVFPGQARIVGGENQIVRSLPELAIREAIVNAIMHRDYRLDRATILALAIGDPSEVLKVRSPGGFPPGVSAARLLATQSTPRNPVLAEAMWKLGLAEREGVGIDSMYRLMLRDGHPEPEIVEEPGEVVVRLAGGAPDLRVRELFDQFARRRKALAEDVRAAIAVEILMSEPVLRPTGLAAASQSSPDDAARTLALLEEAGATERLLNRSQSYRLAPLARAALGDRIRYRTRTTLEERIDEVDALLDLQPDVSRADVAEKLNISKERAGQVVAAMVDKERLVGMTRIRRGPNMRYRRPG